MVRREATSPKGDGSIRRYFCGEAAAAEKEAAVAAAADDGVAAAEVGADNGAHRLRFGDAGLSRGSKSRVRFRVAPHAMAGAPGSGGVREGRVDPVMGIVGPCGWLRDGVRVAWEGALCLSRPSACCTSVRMSSQARARTRSPSPRAWRPDFPGAAREAP